jgi:haloalkane dehalogenase
VNLLRTPDGRFDDLPDWPFDDHYLQVQRLQIAYVDEGDPEADPVLLLHGEPSWSYLYRHMIPALVDAGHRVIAPDLVGFGRSDKPESIDDHTCAAHVGWMGRFVDGLDLRRTTLVCQDWGGLIGLRVVAQDEKLAATGERPGRFAKIVAANTGLPTGQEDMGEAFFKWQKLSQEIDPFPVGDLINGGCVNDLSDEVKAAYDAPFPDESYKAGPRVMPTLVPTEADDPAADANQEAWKTLSRWTTPFLCAFSDSDPITKGGDQPFRDHIPGAKNQPHVTIDNGGHFLQEDEGPRLAEVVNDFIDRT